MSIWSGEPPAPPTTSRPRDPQRDLPAPCPFYKQRHPAKPRRLRDVLEAFEVKPLCTVLDMAGLLGVTENRARSIMLELVQEGVVEAAGCQPPTPRKPHQESRWERHDNRLRRPRGVGGRSAILYRLKSAPGAPE